MLNIFSHSTYFFFRWTSMSPAMNTFKKCSLRLITFDMIVLIFTHSTKINPSF